MHRRRAIGRIGAAALAGGAAMRRCVRATLARGDEVPPPGFMAELTAPPGAGFWVHAVALSTDGNRVAATGVQNPRPWTFPVYCWDLGTNARDRLISFETFCQALAFDSESDRLVAGGGARSHPDSERPNGGRVYAWDVATGGRIDGLAEQGEAVRAVGFGEDASVALLDWQDVFSVVDLHANRTSLVRPQLKGESRWAIGSGGLVSFSADARRAVAVSGTGPIRWGHHREGDAIVKLWDARGDRVDTLRVAGVSTLALSPDGSRFAYGSTNRISVRSFDTPDEIVAHTLEGARRAPSAMAFSPDGRRLAWGDRLGRVTVWPIEPAGPVTHLEGPELSVRVIRFHANGLRVVSGGWLPRGERNRESGFREYEPLFAWDARLE